MNTMACKSCELTYLLSDSGFKGDYNLQDSVQAWGREAGGT